MMSVRILVLFILLHLFAIPCLSQEEVDSKIPNLIDGKENVIIKNKNITDSLRVISTVTVRFTHSLQDLTKEIVVKSVKIRMISINGKRIYSSELNDATELEIYIWKLCERTFDIWYKKQNYKKMHKPKDWYTAVNFTAVVYIVPFD